ncbi:MAG: hypothetical protein R3F43_14240 [bacterium]
MRESAPLLAVKALLPMFAVWLYLRGLASDPALFAALGAVGTATLTARWDAPAAAAGHRRPGGLALAGAWAISRWLLDSTGL